MHFQDKRLYGYNAVTMATSPIFFFTTIHFLVQTYQAIKKIWLCFVLPWGGVTLISRPLLENGRSTTRVSYLIRMLYGHSHCSLLFFYCFQSGLSNRKTSGLDLPCIINLFTTIHDGNFRRHSSMNVTIK